MSNFVIEAQARNDLGKGASRRLRRLAGLVPGVVYGGETAPVSISISHNELLKRLEHEAFFSEVVSLVIDGKAENVKVQDLQRHPSKPVILHIDFVRA